MSPGRRCHNNASTIYFNSRKRNGYVWLSNSWPLVTDKLVQTVNQVHGTDFKHPVDYNFIFRGVWYKTAHHAIQACKFNEANSDAAEILRQQPTMAKLKRMTHIFLQTLEINYPEWLSVRTEVVTAILYAKFSQHEDLKHLLLRTNNRELVEVPLQKDVFFDPSVDFEDSRFMTECLHTVRQRLQEENA